MLRVQRFFLDRISSDILIAEKEVAEGFSLPI